MAMHVSVGASFLSRFSGVPAIFHHFSPYVSIILNTIRVGSGRSDRVPKTRSLVDVSQPPGRSVHATASCESPEETREEGSLG